MIHAFIVGMTVVLPEAPFVCAGSVCRPNFLAPTPAALFAGLLFTASNLLANAQTDAYFFTTLAGRSSSVNPPAVGLFFRAPWGVASDTTGNIYVADPGNHTIRKINRAGLLSTLAGTENSSGSDDGPGSSARFYEPSGVATDGGGNVYVADSGNFAIRKITPAGLVITLAGAAGEPGSIDGTGSNARFSYPEGVATDSAGNVYVADTRNCTIRKVTPTGVVSTVAGVAGSPGSQDGPGSNARFSYPDGVAVDSNGNVYVADAGNYSIRRITPAGLVSTVAGRAGTHGSADGLSSNAQFSLPAGVTVDLTGNIYVADLYSSTIRKITPAGEVSTLAGLAGEEGDVDSLDGNARFHGPKGVAVDSAGDIYVTDSGNYAVRKITPVGEVSTFVGIAGIQGAEDGIGLTARFSSPGDLAVDGVGNVYVADTGNRTIRKITSAGLVSTLAGLAGNSGNNDGAGSSARFSYPEGVAVDGAGTVYVADTANHTIRKITPAGLVSTLAGLAGNSGSDDGAGSNARFSHPEGIAMDSAGTVYVADTGNNAIRKVTPVGLVSTLAKLPPFSFPVGVAVGSGGNVYVTDWNNGIGKITPTGVVSTLAGGRWGSDDGFGINAEFGNPQGIAVDSAGNVYVADVNNDTVRKVTPAGLVSTLAGLAGYSGAADGINRNARFAQPGGIAVDRAGNIYVADTGNNTIRKGVTQTDLYAPRRATATAVVLNGLFLGAVITDPGCGYTNPPVVQIGSGDGEGAFATARVSDGMVVSIVVLDGGSGYTSTPDVVIASPTSAPLLEIAANGPKVKVTEHVILGTTYVLQSSTDLMAWTPLGPQFTAQDQTVSQEFDMDVVARYFRIRQVP